MERLQICLHAGICSDTIAVLPFYMEVRIVKTAVHARERSLQQRDLGAWNETGLHIGAPETAKPAVQLRALSSNAKKNGR